MNPNDLTLKKAKKQDAAAFEEIVMAYQDKIYGICVGMLRNEQDALDAAQDTFLKIYLNLENFQSRSSFSTWAYRIAVNTCLDMIKKRKPLANVVSFDVQDAPPDLGGRAPSAEDEASARFEKEALEGAISRMPEEYRTALVLRDINGLSYDEVAQAMNLNLNTVKSRISRARKALRKMLTEPGELFSFPSV